MTAKPDPRPARKLMVLGLFGVPLLMGVAVLITSRAWPGSNSQRAPEPDVPQQTKKDRTKIALASPGRVEPQAEVVSIGTGISGVVSSVVVREGQRVQVGQTLATLSCHEIEADLSAAAALLEAARQAQDRLLRGSTDDERSEIADRVSAARAAAREARSRYERFAQLAAKDEIPLLDFDRVKLDMDTTNADLRALEHRQAIVNAPPLPEELARQEAETKAAEERQKSLLAKLAQCTVRAPIRGTVVRRFLEPGEIFSVAAPKPIVMLADLSRLKIRAEVDERDVDLVYLGQDAEIQADAFPGKEFAAKVSAIQNMMGRKTVRTGDPAEKSDRDVLEVLLDLSSSRQKLPLGLRVTVKFLEEARGLP